MKNAFIALVLLFMAAKTPGQTANKARTFSPLMPNFYIYTTLGRPW
jgi:hypothetical protein